MPGHVGDVVIFRDHTEIARVPFRIEIDPTALPDLVYQLTPGLGIVVDALRGSCLTRVTVVPGS